MAKVMVVDDAYSELQVMETILRSAGHEVVTSLDGDQLEDKIVIERPDLVLLDIVMPKRNGYEALRGLRKDDRTKGTRVVVVSEQLLAVVRRFVK
jgi:twitching motility two-component system response regulator PilH